MCSLYHSRAGRTRPNAAGSRDAGVLRSEKIGKEVWFWIDRNWLLAVFADVAAYIAEAT